MTVERTTTFEALEHRFDVVVENLPGTAEYLQELLSPLADDGFPTTSYRLTYDRDPSAEQHYVLWFQDEQISRSAGQSRALSLLLWHINQETVRLSGERYVLLHAAAARRDGVTVVLPAPMEHGKTTTVAGLLLRAFDYITDEAVAIDRRTGLITPFPKPLSVDPGSWPLLLELAPTAPQIVLNQWVVPVARIPGVAVAPAAPPRLIIAPAYRPGVRTELVQISRATMLAELLPSTFNLSPHPIRQMEVLRRSVMGCECFRLAIGDLGEAVALIEGAVDDVR